MAKVDMPTGSDHRPKADLEKRYREQLELKRRPVSKTDLPKKKEPGMLDSLLRELIVNDVDEVRRNVVKDVIKPSIKRTIFNSIVEGARQLLDEGGVPLRSSLDNTYFRGVNSDQRGVNNSSIRSNSSNRALDSGSGRRFDRFDSRNYPFPNRGKAEEVLYILRKDIETYHKATVAAFLKEAGYNPDYNDYDIGWDDLSEGNCYVRGSLDGYFVVLPAPRRVSDL